MTLLNTIKNDQLQARKDKSAEAASLLTTLYAEASMVGKNNGRETTDAEVVAVIKKFLKNNTEFLSNINDTHKEYEKLINEKHILEKYLPKQLSEMEMKEIVVNFKNNSDNVNVGVVMKHMKENYDGQYDGKILSSIVKDVLS